MDVSPQTPGWVRDAVFYQIFPDRFARSPRARSPGPFEAWDAPPTTHGFKGGDLFGVTEHLDYLVDLGVTALYLNPIFASASNHRYHTFDYFRVDPLLGGDEAFDELLGEAHQRGMRVVLDGVFNHSGRGFWPFHHVLEAGAASPYRGWFHLGENALEGRRQVRAYPSRAEMEALIRWRDADGGRPPGAASRAVLGYEAWWDLPALPKLNVGDPAMREHLLGAAEYWVRQGIDGWRLDVPEEITDDEFWREFRRRVRGANPEAYIVAEIWHVAPHRLLGDQFDATMNYPLAEAILGFAAGEHLDRGVIDRHPTYAEAVQSFGGAGFGQRLEELLAAYDPDVTAVQLNLLGSHDLPRFITMCGGDRDSLRLGSLLQMTLPGAPCVYYGDEIGLEGGLDPGSRGSFPWEEEHWDHELRAFIRDAIALRAAHPVLRHGETRIVGAGGRTVAYSRSSAEEMLIVAVNAGEGSERLTVDAPEAAGRPLETLSIGARPSPASVPRAISDEGSVELDVPPRAGVILRIL